MVKKEDGKFLRFSDVETIEKVPFALTESRGRKAAIVERKLRRKSSRF